MSILSKLKLSDQTRAKAIASPEVRRREKLLTNIDRQIKAAEAVEKGELYTFQAMRHVTHAETGERTRQSVSVKVRPWWWTDMQGKYFTCVKYGNRKLELAKGMKAIEIGGQKNLVPTLEKVAEAVRGGEMDEIITGVAKFGAAIKN